MDISMTCSTCGKVETAKDVKQEDLIRHVNGELVQNVWPERNDTEREIIMNFNKGGIYICSECWDLVLDPTDDDIEEEEDW